MGTGTFDFEGESVIVTGSTKGIGRGIAAGFAAAGADVVVNSRTEADVDQVADELDESASGDVIGVAGDVGDPADVERLVETCIERLGGVDHLVNNAAVWPDAGPLDGDLDEYDHGIAVNARGPYYAAVLAARDMRDRCVAGSVVNVTSVKGHQAADSGSLYGMSKAAQNGVTWRLATALAEYDIRVNAVSTDLNEGLVRRSRADAMGYDDPNHPDVTAEIDRIADEELDIPLGRAGRATEMADGAMFLASDLASYVTGHVLRINGGRSLV